MTSCDGTKITCETNDEIWYPHYPEIKDTKLVFNQCTEYYLKLNSQFPEMRGASRS